MLWRTPNIELMHSKTEWNVWGQFVVRRMSKGIQQSLLGVEANPSHRLSPYKQLSSWTRSEDLIQSKCL